MNPGDREALGADAGREPGKKTRPKRPGVPPERTLIVYTQTPEQKKAIREAADAENLSDSRFLLLRGLAPAGEARSVRDQLQVAQLRVKDLEETARKRDETDEETRRKLADALASKQLLERLLLDAQEQIDKETRMRYANREALRLLSIARNEDGTPRAIPVAELLASLDSAGDPSYSVVLRDEFGPLIDVGILHVERVNGQTAYKWGAEA